MRYNFGSFLDKKCFEKDKTYPDLFCLFVFVFLIMALCQVPLVFDIATDIICNNTTSNLPAENRNV